MQAGPGVPGLPLHQQQQQQQQLGTLHQQQQQQLGTLHQQQQQQLGTRMLALVLACLLVHMSSPCTVLMHLNRQTLKQQNAEGSTHFTKR